MNLWRNSIIAIAYSYQQNAEPYLDLLKTTESFLSPETGQRWLDLGCGSGRLVRSIWDKSHGTVSEIVAVDISPVALNIARRMLARAVPAQSFSRINFVVADLSHGLDKLFRAKSFDGVTAGLSISYADHWNQKQKKWDNQAYLDLLRAVYVLLKQGGVFIFSTNVPRPNFWIIARRSWRKILFTWKLPVGLAVSIVMLLQARWLKRSAKKGRFHYLAADQIVGILLSVGFKDVRYELTYADQAWVFAATK